MTLDLSAILGLAVLIVGLFAWLRSDIAAVRADMTKLGDRLGQRIDRLEIGRAHV